MADRDKPEHSRLLEQAEYSRLLGRLVGWRELVGRAVFVQIVGQTLDELATIQDLRVADRQIQQFQTLIVNAKGKTKVKTPKSKPGKSTSMSKNAPQGASKPKKDAPAKTAAPAKGPVAAPSKPKAVPDKDIDPKKPGTQVEIKKEATSLLARTIGATDRYLKFLRPIAIRVDQWAKKAEAGPEDIERITSAAVALTAAVAALETGHGAMSELSTAFVVPRTRRTGETFQPGVEVLVRPKLFDTYEEIFANTMPEMKVIKLTKDLKNVACLLQDGSKAVFPVKHLVLASQLRSDDDQEDVEAAADETAEEAELEEAEEEAEAAEEEATEEEAYEEEAADDEEAEEEEEAPAPRAVAKRARQ
jgi:Fe-S-cluster containining protein